MRYWDADKVLGGRAGKWLWKWLKFLKLHVAEEKCRCNIYTCQIRIRHQGQSSVTYAISLGSLSRELASLIVAITGRSDVLLEGCDCEL